MNEVNIFEAFEVAWRRKLLILVVVAIATASAYFFSESRPDLYQAETTLVFPGGAPGPGIGAIGQIMGRMPPLLGALDGGSYSTSVIQPLLKSRTLAERVVVRCGLRSEYRTGSIQGATSLLKRDTSIAQDPTGAVILSVKATDPKLAAQIANCYVTELNHLATQKIDLSMVARSARFVTTQQARVKKELDAAEVRLRDFQARNQIVALPDETRAAVQQVADLERERTMAEIGLQDTTARIDEQKRQIEAQTSRPVEDLPAHSPVIQGLREKLVSLTADLALAEQEFTDEHPEVQKLKAGIAETRRQIELEVGRVREALASGLSPELTRHEVDRIALEARSEAAALAVARLQRKFERLPDDSLQLARLTRDKEVQESLYTMLTSEREKLRILQAREGPPFEVLDVAIPPEGRIWPRPQLISVLAAILGFIVAIVLAFFMEYAERVRYVRSQRAGFGEAAGVPIEESLVERPAHARRRA